MNDRRIVRASLNDREVPVFDEFKSRMGISEDSEAIKLAIYLSHHYLDKFEESVPHAVFERYLAKLKYEKVAFKDKLKFKLVRKDRVFP